MSWLRQARHRRLIEDMTRKAMRYFLVGGASALVEWGTFALLAYGAAAPLGVSAVVGFFTATMANYVLSLRFVFVGRAHRRVVELALVYAVSGVALVVNFAVFIGLVETAGVEPMLGKIAGTGVAFGVNFLLRYLLVFREAAVAASRGD